MLVQLTDMKGEPLWVNPIHVRLVQIKRRKTELAIGLVSVHVQESAEEVAGAISAAMPAYAYAPEMDAQQAAVNAVTTAAMMG